MLYTLSCVCTHSSSCTIPALLYLKGWWIAYTKRRFVFSFVMQPLFVKFFKNNVQHFPWSNHSRYNFIIALHCQSGALSVCGCPFRRTGTVHLHMDPADSYPGWPPLNHQNSSSYRYVRWSRRFLIHRKAHLTYLLKCNDGILDRFYGCTIKNLHRKSGKDQMDHQCH